MTILPYAVGGSEQRLLTRLLRLGAGVLTAVLGVILGYMPFVPFVYGLLSLLIAALFFAQASPWCAGRIRKLPLIGKDIDTCLIEGVTPKLRRKIIRFTVSFMALVIYANPEAWEVILLYLATVPFIMAFAWCWNTWLSRPRW